MVKLLLELNKLISCILGEATFPLWWLNRAHVDLCLVRPCGSIVPREQGVKYRVVLSKQGLEIGPDGLR